MPMTSPVERISGPRITSTPGNLLNGNTLSLTDVWSGAYLSDDAEVPALQPAMTFAAMRAQLTPVALLTNGTVRLARGLTSMT
jgi:hypothetical protein